MYNGDMTRDQVINVDPQRMGGRPCFRGTRVPVQTLLDYLGDGYTLAEFLADYPTVPRELAVAYLRLPLEAAATGDSAA